MAPDQNEFDEWAPPEVSAEAVMRLHNVKIPNDSGEADVSLWIARNEAEGEEIFAELLRGEDEYLGGGGTKPLPTA